MSETVTNSPWKQERFKTMAEAEARCAELENDPTVRGLHIYHGHRACVVRYLVKRMG